MEENKLDKLTDKQFAVLFKDILKRIKKDPMKNFVEAKHFMNFKPSIAQRVILKVVFQQKLDNRKKFDVPIENSSEEAGFLTVNSKMTETELYKYLTGFAYNREVAVKTVVHNINLVCGRRSGKTTLAAILVLYCAITTNWKPYLYKHPFATVLVMSHSTDFSIEILDVIKYFIRESPLLAKLINKSRKQTLSTFNLKMPFLQKDGKIEESQVQIKVGAASSKTTRGIAACAVICDEIAFWNLDDSLKETDTKILKAVEPALAQFGNKAFMFKLSSPGIRQGVLYSEHLKHLAGTLPSSYAVFKAPSWMMNLIIEENFFKEKYALDSEGFMVEYGGEFSDSLSSFIMSAAIEQAIMKGMVILPPGDDPNLKFHAAIDAGFKGDTFTFSVVASDEKRVRQCLAHSWQGTKAKPLKSQPVAKWIAQATKTFPLDYIGADQFAFQPLQEIFNLENLTLKEYVFSSTFKKKIYYNLKKLIHSNQIDLLDIPKQTSELRELTVEQAPSGAIKIGHPKGGSDDYADALAIAAYIATVELGSGLFSMEDVARVVEHNIKVSSEGIAFTAPSPTMLVNSGHFGENIQDNSSEYGVDPADGRLKKIYNFVVRAEEEIEDTEFSMG